MPKHTSFITGLFLLFATSVSSLSMAESLNPKVLGELSRVDLQYRTTREALAALDKIDKADLLLNLSKKHLTREIRKDLKSRLWAANVDGTKAATIREIEVSLGSQIIDIDARFVVHVREPDSIYKGIISGTVAPTHSGNILYFQPAFNSITFEEIDKKPVHLEWSSFKNTKKLVEKLTITHNATIATKLGHPVLKKFLINLNDKLYKKPVTIPVELSPVVTKKMTKLVPDKKGIQHSGGKRDFLLRPNIGNAAFHINTRRLSIIASLDPSKPGHSGEEIYDESGASGIPATTFKRTFQELISEFSKIKRKSFFSKNERNLHGTHAMLRKGFLAEQLGKLLKSPDFCLSYKAGEYKQTFSQKVLVDSSDLPSCSQLKQDCEQQYRQCSSAIQECIEDCGSNYGEHRCSCSGNDREEQKCQITELPACQSAQQAKHRACELRNQACKNNMAGDKKSCQQVQTSCTKANARTVKRCEANKAGFGRHRDRLQLAKFSGDTSVHGIYAQACINAVEFNDNLTESTIETVMTGLATINMSGQISAPEKQQLDCQFSSRPGGTVDAKVVQTNNIKAKLHAKKTGDLINIRATVTTPKITASSATTPLLSMLSPSDLKLDCTFHGLPAIKTRAREIAELIEAPNGHSLLAGKVNIKPASFKLDFDIKPLVIEFSRKQIRLKPNWKNTSISFE